MALDIDGILKAMVTAGQGLAGTVWQDIQVYAVPELKKIATQIEAIETAMLEPNPPYTQEGAKVLLNMQITASVGVIVAMTSLTLIAVQTAINAILDSIKTAVNQAIGFVLIA